MLRSYQPHSFSVLTVLVSNKSFTRQVCLNVKERFGKQSFKTFFVRFERYTSMNKKGKIRPDIMNSFYLMVFNYFFNCKLNPSRDTHYKTNIPFTCFFNYFIYFILPVPVPGYFFSRLIKRLKPKGRFFLYNSAKIAGIVPLSLLQVGATTNCQPSFSY